MERYVPIDIFEAAKLREEEEEAERVAKQKRKQEDAAKAR